MKPGDAINRNGDENVKAQTNPMTSADPAKSVASFLKGILKIEVHIHPSATGNANPFFPLTFPETPGPGDVPFSKCKVWVWQDRIHMGWLWELVIIKCHSIDVQFSQR